MAGRNAQQPLYVTCPYDINHRLAPRSYAAHIDKCARTSKKVLSICKYNSLHRIEPALLAHHYAEECADKPAYVNDGWDDIPTRAAQEAAQINNLADALEAAEINEPLTEPPTSTSSFTSTGIDDWDTGERHNYLAPDITCTVNAKPAGTFTMNKILVQGMTKSQRKKFYDEQLAQNLARIEKGKLEREGKEKRQEMEAKRQQELVERAAIEKEKQEREEKRKELEKKKKEKKERIKAAKRAAYLVKNERLDEQEKQDGTEEKQDEQEKQTQQPRS